ncbi:MAG: DUF1987 domain-containing protein [Bacteroidales bacterium]|nr:DUF1987 domain-containing protein [Bacteroidales bacterium]
MLDNLIIKPVEEGLNSPGINFNASTGVLEVYGESYVENAKEFYEPVLAWLNVFIDNYTGTLTFNFKLNYYNTSSSRSIQDIFTVLRRFEEKGNELNVFWFYDEDEQDPELEEEVEDFEIVSGVSIKLVANPAV